MRGTQGAGLPGFRGFGKHVVLLGLLSLGALPTLAAVVVVGSYSQDWVYHMEACNQPINYKGM